MSSISRFKEQFRDDIPKLNALAEYIVSTIIEKTRAGGKDPDVFYRIKPSIRLKKEKSLIAKAFYRDKEYSDPYNDITDKVGVRFVVLLADEVKSVGDILKTDSDLSISQDRDYLKDREENPTTFDYQSDHFIVFPKSKITHGGVEIEPRIKCEVQIRTLVQHAYSELTHDTLYKPQMRKTHTMQRLASRSMALLESADHFFTQIYVEMDSANKAHQNILEQLRSIAAEYSFACDHVISEIVLDAYLGIVCEDKMEAIETFFKENSYILDMMNDRRDNEILSDLSMLVVYYAISIRRIDAKRAWPYEEKSLEILFSDLGRSLPD